MTTETEKKDNIIGPMMSMMVILMILPLLTRTTAEASTAASVVIRPLGMVEFEPESIQIATLHVNNPTTSTWHYRVNLSVGNFFNESRNTVLESDDTGQLEYVLVMPSVESTHNVSAAVYNADTNEFIKTFDLGKIIVKSAYTAPNTAWEYDRDGDGVISLSEYESATEDYYYGVIPRALWLMVRSLYLHNVRYGQLKGDFDDDGDIDYNDYTEMLTRVGAILGEWLGDLNNDGIITEADVDILKSYMFGHPISSISPLPEDKFLFRADVNRDGTINAGDTTKLNRIISGLDDYDDGYHPIADFNEDGLVDSYDLNTFLSSYEATGVGVAVVWSRPPISIDIQSLYLANPYEPDSPGLGVFIIPVDVCPVEGVFYTVTKIKLPSGLQEVVDGYRKFKSGSPYYLHVVARADYLSIEVTIWDKPGGILLASETLAS